MATPPAMPASETPTSMPPGTEPMAF
jgi:hypothetical protein